jgi:hypothetical protein
MTVAGIEKVARENGNCYFQVTDVLLRRDTGWQNLEQILKVRSFLLFLFRLSAASSTLSDGSNAMRDGFGLSGHV